MKQRWLLCEVSNGMLPDEVAVVIKGAEQDLSLFLPADQVHRQASLTSIAVDVIDEDEQYGLVTLPKQPIEGSRVVKVLKNRLFA